MGISKLILHTKLRGLNPFCMGDLGEMVVLAGGNGSGKSRILKLLARRILLAQMDGASTKNQQEDDDEILQYLEIVRKKNDDSTEDKALGQITLINYSQYDIPLQLPDVFLPYVIAQAENNLAYCDFEETARDALLYVQYIAQYSKDEAFKVFREKLLDMTNIDLTREEGTNKPLFFGRQLQQHGLSPGQQYLLRMCVALHCNKTSGEDFLLLIDEPETHLHPEALWHIVDKIKEHFGKGQIWIATHSVALLSMVDPSCIWHVKMGDTTKRLGSYSNALLQGLVGDETRRMAFQKFISYPDLFACYQYAAECLLPPDSKGAPAQGDPQIEQIGTSIKTTEAQRPIVIVDFGAGKGRLLDGIAMDFNELLPEIRYIAYNTHNEDAEDCKHCMESHGIPSAENYFYDINSLTETIGKTANIVFMVNVLHEISPKEWHHVFCEVDALLAENGKLVIVELSEFTFGEKAYKDGCFLVVQHDAMTLLNTEQATVVSCHHPERKHIARYEVPKELLQVMTEEKAKEIVLKISAIALSKAKELRGQQVPNRQYGGLKLAFWTQQFTDATLITNDWDVPPCEGLYHNGHKI